MSTNPPTPADRLAATRAEVLACLRAWEPSARLLGNVSAADLRALLAADPPGATVTVVCACGHEETDHLGRLECYNDHAQDWDTADPATMCECPAWQPTDARVSYTRPLTEEERTR